MDAKRASQRSFSRKMPVRKGKTAILTSRQQPTGLHRSFPSVGPMAAGASSGKAQEYCIRMYLHDVGTRPTASEQVRFAAAASSNRQQFMSG